MKKFLFTILIYIVTIILIDYNVSYSRVIELTKYDRIASYYSWMNPILYFHIKKSCIKYKVKEELVCAVIQRESKGRNIRGIGWPIG